MNIQILENNKNTDIEYFFCLKKCTELGDTKLIPIPFKIIMLTALFSNFISREC